jgi:hypothetical protein
MMAFRHGKYSARIVPALKKIAPPRITLRRYFHDTSLRRSRHAKIAPHALGEAQEETSSHVLPEKMMKRIALLALLLCGCADAGGTGGWVKNGASQADFNIDRRQCQAQSMGNPNAPSIQAADLYNSCMQGRGWHRGSQESDQGRSKRCGLDQSGYFSCSFN